MIVIEFYCVSFLHLDSERNFSNNSKKFKRIPELAHDLIASPNIVSSPSVHSLLSVVGTASEHDHMEVLVVKLCFYFHFMGIYIYPLL